jgi:serine/threonine-protein kinase
MDGSGRTTVLRAMPADWSNATFSPDGRRLAMDIIDGGNTDIWIYDLARDQISRLTSDPGDDLSPAWTPDGRRVVFSSTRGGQVPNLYWQAIDGSDEATRLTNAPFDQFATSWHPSGRFLAFRQVNPQTGSDVMILPLEGSDAAGWKPGTPTTLLNSRFEERMPEFSPDGRWLAYVSNESGRFEVYVRSFPGPGGKWPVSVSGSTGIFAAAWSRARNELFFESPDGHIMAASYTTTNDSFGVDKPRVWSEKAHLFRPRWRSFDLHRDGQRVITAPVPDGPTPVQDTVVLVSNFFDEIRRRASPSH